MVAFKITIDADPCGLLAFVVLSTLPNKTPTGSDCGLSVNVFVVVSPAATVNLFDFDVSPLHLE